VTETIVTRPAQQPVQAQFDVAAIMGGLYGDGIIGYYEALPDQVKQHLTTPRGGRVGAHRAGPQHRGPDDG
jgi:hypothetical protein